MQITLKDGKKVIIMDERDALEIIREYLGDDFAKECNMFTTEDFYTLEKIKEITDQDEVYRLVNTII